MNGQNLTVLTSHDISGILNSKVQSAMVHLKAAVIQGVSKVLGIEYHLHCSWRPQSSEKVEKANGIIKRHLWKLTQKTQDSCFKNLPIALMRAQTAPKKGLSLWQTVFVHRYCHRPWSLRINYVTQLSAFQPPHQLKASHGGFLHFKEGTFFNSANTFTNDNHMQRLFLVWWHLTILRWTGITYCTLTMNIMWLLILIRF